jgi:hypothetical protein
MINKYLKKNKETVKEIYLRLMYSTTPSLKILVQTM